MKIARQALAVLLLITCACVSNNSSLRLAKMTDDDLNRLVQQKHSFEEMRGLLGLQNTEYHIAENGSGKEIYYRFTVGNRTLFLETAQSNLVVQAFFARNSDPVHSPTPTTGPGEVLKPK